MSLGDIAKKTLDTELFEDRELAKMNYFVPMYGETSFRVIEVKTYVNNKGEIKYVFIIAEDDKHYFYAPTGLAEVFRKWLEQYDLDKLNHMLASEVVSFTCEEVGLKEGKTYYKFSYLENL